MGRRSKVQDIFLEQTILHLKKCTAAQVEQYALVASSEKMLHRRNDDDMGPGSGSILYQEKKTSSLKFSLGAGTLWTLFNFKLRITLQVNYYIPNLQRKKLKLRETKKVQSYRASEHLNRNLDLGPVEFKIFIFITNRLPFQRVIWSQLLKHFILTSMALSLNHSEA